MKHSSRWLIMSLLLVAGCDSRDSGTGATGKQPAPQTSPRIPVLVTVYPVAEMVKRVGRDFVNVEWLAEGGQRPEEIESTPALRQRAGNSTLIVTSGAWDRWVYGELSEEARASRVIEPARMPAARGAPAGAYLWLDPAVMRELTEAVRERLTVIDPGHETAYRANAAAYRAEIDAVETELTAAIGDGAATGRRVLAVRPVWGAMTARYGVTTVSPAAGPAEERLAAGEFTALARLGKDIGRRSLFIDAWTPAAVRLRIEGQTGLTAIALDATGTSAPDGRSTWARVMRFNLAELRKGLD